MNVFSIIFKISLMGLFALTILSCKKDQLRMTVILFDNQNPGDLVTTDTLILDSLIDSKKAHVDIYFCWTKFQIPYYLPTGGIYKNSAKEKECDMSIYAHNAKCYTYDEKNRVIQMLVDGSGTMGTWNYKYDSLDRSRI